MNRSEIVPMPDFFGTYIRQVEEENLFDALKNSIMRLENLNMDLLKRVGDQVYKPGKWTIKDIFQHLIDNERVQTYRAMRFARNDKTLLPGYDENLFAEHSMANKRSLENIVDEMIILRRSTINLFDSFDASVMQNSGICFGQVMSVGALGFMIIGHEIHHMRVIKERYSGLAV